MKPDSNEETVTKMTTNTAKIKSATNPKQSPLVKNLIALSNKIYATTVRDGHVPKYCIMCSDHTWQKNERIQYMGLSAFKWHLKSISGSDGQRLNSETLIDMYNSYRKIVERLRRTDNERKNGPSHNIKVVVGCLHD